MTTLKIVGNRHRPLSAQIRLAELPFREPLFLQFEPDNKFDANAIKVMTADEICLGYIAKSKNKEIGKYMKTAGVAVETHYLDDSKLEITFGPKIQGKDKRADETTQLSDKST